MILVDYIQCIKYPIFNISVKFHDVKFHQSWEAKVKLLDNVFGRKRAGKNDSFWILYQLIVFYECSIRCFYFVQFSGKYHEKCRQILYAYLNGCH